MENKNNYEIIDDWAYAEEGMCFTKGKGSTYHRGVLNPDSFDYITMEEAEKQGGKPSQKSSNITKEFAPKKSDESDKTLPSTDKFEEKKKELMKFAKSGNSNVQLEGVSVAKQVHEFVTLDWLSAISNQGHKVTGKEFNESIEKIRDEFIKQNKVIKKTKKEFITIYDTFEALDTDYLRRIMVNLKAAEDASNTALEASEQAKDGLVKIETTQDDVKQLIEQNQEEIRVLKAHQDKITEFENHSKAKEKAIEKHLEEILTISKSMSETAEAKEKAIEKHLEEILTRSKSMSETADNIQTPIHQLIDSISSIYDTTDANKKELEEQIIETKAYVKEERDIAIVLLDSRERLLNKKIRTLSIFAIITFVLLVIMFVLIMTGIL
ncbi:MAG: hypothetical protein FWE43_00625 [Streptococcaceae bacterium]|nr:hypothetical protein [Streptococcaceae bacterium]MCL2680981.1 hypothetical protein [Streptococcaceae bacterium]